MITAVRSMVASLAMRKWRSCCLGLLCLASVSSRCLAATPELKSSYHEDSRGTPRLFFPDQAMGNKSSAAGFLQAQSTLFKLPADLSNLEVVSVSPSLVGLHTRYRQVLNGLPVEGGEIIVSQRKSDQSVYQVYNNTYPVEQPVSPSKSIISRDAALAKAWDHLRVHGRLKALPRTELIYTPGKGGFRLVYKTLLAVENPNGYWDQKVDAQSGEVVSVRRHEVSGKQAIEPVPDFASWKGPTTSLAEELSRLEAEARPAVKTLAPSGKTIVDGTALVFDPDPRTTLANAALVDSSSAASFNAAYFTRPLRQISLESGVYRLEGPYVTIVSMPSELPATPVSTTTSGNWTAKRGNNAFNDVMCYFHIDQNQRYIQSLGYTNEAGIQAAPIAVDSDGVDSDDNSHYIPSENSLAFGHGDVDDDEDADVILHEYGHAITFDITPSWDGGDSGAIGEGFGDYWGASYSWSCSNGATFHPAWAFSWDGHSADSWPGRFLDMTNLTYDHSHTYSDHESIDGISNYSDQLWGTPIFQAFRDLIDLGYPREDMDKIILESFFGVGARIKMRDMANATVMAARELFPDGPHAEIYFNRFLNQNILLNYQMPDPVILSPAGGEVFPTGSTIMVQWDLNGAPATAATCIEYTTKLAGEGAAFSDTVENGINGWMRHRTGGTDWNISTVTNHSSSHSWFATDEPYACEQFLTSPSIPIGPRAVLSFWHFYKLESSYDGGVVEISTDGTTWQDLGDAATENGYNATLSSSYDNPIGGRRAFSGISAGFVKTTIPLSAYAGQTVQFRFREGDDSSLKTTGWWVDDIEVAIDPVWMPLATTPTNAVAYEWTRPELAGTNYALRLKLTGSNCTDSAWVASGAFTLLGDSPPVDIGLSRSFILENQPAGSQVGILSTMDSDVSNTFTYVLAAGAGLNDNDLFAIDGTTLVTAISFNYEARNSYLVRIRTTDQSALFYEREFTLAVSNIASEYALEVVTANGSVVRTPSAAFYDEGAAVSLSATASTGYHFAGWSGSATSTSNPLSVTMDGPKTISAMFTLNVVTVLTDRASVSLSEGGSASFQVKLSAQPTGTRIVSVARTAGDADIRPTAGTNLTFSTSTWGTYQTVTLGAAEDDGENLNGEAVITCQGTDLIPSTVAAVEIDDDYTLAIVAVNGTVTRTPDTALYDKGSVVSLRPFQSAGYRFSGWSGGAKGSTIPVSVTMNSNTTVTASFTMNVVTVLTDRVRVTVPEGGSTNFQVKLSAQPTGETAIAVARTAGDEDISVGAGASLTFSTENWAVYQSVTLAAAEDNGDNAKGSATITCGAPGMTNGVLEATEGDDDFSLVVDSFFGTVDVSPASPYYENGAVVTLTAHPELPYFFKGWEGSLFLTNNPGSLTMDSDKHITACYGPTAPIVLPPSRIVRDGFTARWKWIEGSTPEGQLEVSSDAAFTQILWGYKPLYVANSTECPVSGLFSGMDYWYRVRRLMPDGSFGAWSAKMKVKTGKGIPSFKNLLSDVPVSKGVTQDIALTNLVAGSGTLSVKSSNPNAVKTTLTSTTLRLQYLWTGATSAKVTLILSHPASGYKAEHAAVLNRAQGSVVIAGSTPLTNVETRVAQDITLENQTGALVYGLRVRVKGLDNTAWLINRTGFDPVTKLPVLELPCVLPAGSQTVVRLVYNKAYKTQAASRPVAVGAWAIMPANAVNPVNTEMGVSREDLFDGLRLLGMPANRNRLYGVKHSDDGGQTWNDNGPLIRATANYLMWMDADEGAPAGRLYRIVDVGM